MKRFSLAMAATALALSGCADGGLDPIAETALIAFTGMPSPPLSRAQVNALPYASMAGKIGKGPRSLLILAEADGDGQTFAGADNSLFVFRNGRLVRTLGLPRNLQSAVIAGMDPLADRSILKDGQHRFALKVDLEPLHRYGVMVHCDATAVGRETIEILDLKFDTTHLAENCSSQEIDWSFDNEYWIDDAGAVWKSIQHFYPDTPPLHVEMLKPPAPPT